MKSFNLEAALALGDLHDDGLNAAIEAATEANRAGLEPQAQLIHGIKAYLYVTEGEMMPEGFVPTPTNFDQAFLMVDTAEEWMKENAR